MNNPLISIIIPAYNRATLIKDTLQSIIAQSSSDWECIVIDDGSTDTTVEVVSAFAKANSRIQLHKRSESYQSGGNGARQMGLDIASSDWVLFVDSDDVLAENCIENRINTIDETLDMTVFHTATFKKNIGDHQIYWNLLHEKETNEEYLIRFLIQDMPWHTMGVLWRKKFLQHIGGWNQNLTAWQDWELHVRALTYKPKIKSNNTIADNYYRLDVVNSIASKKRSLQYNLTIKKAIECVEAKVLHSFTASEIKKRIQYLIYRNLIANPIKWKLFQLPFALKTSDMSFSTVSKQKFLRAYWKERFFSITIIKRILKHKCKLSYYDYLYPTTTFLKKRF
ncbi:hypothetical protein GCM10011344_31090 [Dokdonia pacifica]|uniref:Glycosyltransferase involved in cell wall bisynthesis n=1 Tax=Dokdonia pacifica TaxID=1627892 RepID=A0A239BSV7_9FLAO|nr:glycosyltransferase family A protein [Dokdonia pacifica]GGG28067.1 hypothetical protein GCM10011344_31090 [Dokdonia pacifica]SNS10134.1 Glycosyltransferase involved in cell wall bisynthesis [Dokdonia pacifica]